MNMSRGGRDDFRRNNNRTYDNQNYRGQKQPKRGRYNDEDD